MDAAYLDELRGRIQAVLFEVADQLPAPTVGLIDELLDANEFGVAVEVLSDGLLEANAVLNESMVQDIGRVVAMMSLDPISATQLEPLTRGPNPSGPP